MPSWQILCLNKIINVIFLARIRQSYQIKAIDWCHLLSVVQEFWTMLLTVHLCLSMFTPSWLSLKHWWWLIIHPMLGIFDWLSLFVWKSLVSLVYPFRLTLGKKEICLSFCTRQSLSWSRRITPRRIICLPWTVKRSWTCEGHVEGSFPQKTRA